jgi:CRP-like cAMP-binding protein
MQKIFLFRKKNMDIDDLLLCPICRNIPVDERENFLNELKFKIKLFKKGEWVFQQGDVVNALYILLKGSVKAEMVSGSGSSLNVEIIAAPSPLASAFLFAENNQFPVDVMALEECEVVVISKESVMKQLASNPTFLQQFMAYNANRTHFLSERLKILSTKTIKGKLAQYILDRNNAMAFSMDMSQTHLAEYFGVTRPSLARSLSEIIQDEIISLKGKKGKILNFNKLRKLITNG